MIVAAILLTSNHRKPEPSPVGQTKPESRSSHNESWIADPTVRALQAIEIHWATEEREHHRKERWYWRLTAILTLIAVAGAVATVILSQLSLQEARRATREAEKATGEAHRQADEAHRQAEEVAKQTEAIKASSDATIRSAEANISAAEAQRKMAEITAQAQKPDIDLMDIVVVGFNSAPENDGNVHFTLSWHFRDVGGSALTVKNVSYGLPVGQSLPQDMPEGLKIDGAGIVLTNSITSAFGPKDPIPFTMSTATRDAVISRAQKLFFFAKIEYWDNTKSEHYRCFGREFAVRSADNLFPIPSGGEAYQCAS